jgi:type I restriction enzyme, S subunit
VNWPIDKVESIKADTRNALVGGPFGSELTTRHYIEEGVPVIRGANLSNEQAFKDDGFVFVSEEKADKLISNNAYPGDLIFTQRGTLGQVGVIPKNSNFPRYIVSQSQMKLRVDTTKADERFVYYFFRHPETVQSIKNRAITSGVPHINLGILREFEIPVPHLDVQRKIVTILSTYDDLIENNRRRMALLEEAARLLYQEWFVHLRFPGHEHTRITEGVPKGWERKAIGELADITMGQSPESKFYNDVGEGIPFHQGVTDFGDRFVTNRIYSTAFNRIADAGEILCSVRAPVGKLNITLEKIVIGRGLAALRSRTKHQSLLFYQLRNYFFTEDIIGTGAIFASVTKHEFSNQKLLAPPKRLAGTFEDLTVNIDDEIRLLHLQNQKLRAARDLLLPRLMSREIAV